MSEYIRTIYEMFNHVITKHPELASTFERLAIGAQNKRDEFQEIATKWVEDKGDETLRLDYSLTEDSIVFDLGGYRGDFAEAIHKKFNCHVYVYEPVNQFYAFCVDRFKDNPKIKCFNYGLSNQDGTLLINKDGDASSLIKADFNKNSEEVYIKSFENEFISQNIDGIDLLKINVEGAEFLILPHLISAGLVGKINNIQVQFHTFYPNSWKLRDEIRLKLSATHEEDWNYPFIWESWHIR